VERLARRCGYDAVAAAIPEAHRKLLTHIRKERVRKDGRRHSEAGSEVRTGWLQQTLVRTQQPVELAWALCETCTGAFMHHLLNLTDMCHPQCGALQSLLA